MEESLGFHNANWGRSRDRTGFLGNVRVGEMDGVEWSAMGGLGQLDWFARAWDQVNSCFVIIDKR